jgi:hypothetical protein
VEFPLHVSGDRTLRFRDSCNQVYYLSDPRNPNYQTLMSSHQKKSTTVIPRLIQRSACFSRIGISRLSIPKSLVNANPQIPKSRCQFRLFGFREFASRGVMKLCSMTSKILTFYFPKIQKYQSSTRSPTLVPQLDFSAFSGLHTSRVLMQIFQELNPRNPKMEYTRENPTALVDLNLRLYLS